MSESAKGNAASRLLGRERDLAAIVETFAAGARLVTLVGPAGVGKTSLALRCREALEEKFLRAGAGGAWFCDLTGARSAEEICTVVGQAMGIPLGATRADGDALELLGRAIAGRGPMLVVLDNCEQVVDAVAQATTRWLLVAPAVTFLATSRERLRTTEERVHEVDALDEASAVQLFVDRARAVAPSSVSGASAETTETIAEIVRRLDRLPLAIELAAARAGVLPPPELLRRLDRRFDVLAGGRRGVAPRQATLRAAIDASWELLDDDERSVLAQLSVFRGDFVLEAVEAVVGARARLDVIQALHDKSLVRTRNEGDRSRFALYESVRDYAAEKLKESGDERVAQERHAAWFLAHAGADGGDADNLLAVVARATGADALLPIDTALRALLALEPIASLRGPFVAWRARLDSVLNSIDPRRADPSVHARVLLARARAHLSVGSLDEARRDVDAAIARAPGDAISICAHAQATMGAIERNRGRLSEAARALEAARTSLAADPDPRVEREILAELAAVYEWQGRLDEASSLLRDAIAIDRSLGDRRAEGVHLASLAAVLHAARKLPEARHQYELATAILDDVGDRPASGACSASLGVLLQEQAASRAPASGASDFDEARAHYEQALRIHREVGARRAYAIALGYVAMLEHERGELEAARRGYEDAVARLHAVDDALSATLFRAALGAVHAACDRAEEATRAFDAAEVQARALGSAPLLATVALHRGHLDLAAARAAVASKSHAEGDRLRIRVQERIVATLTSVLRQSDDIRFAARLLRAGLGAAHREVGSTDASTAAPASIAIGPEAEWFRLAGGDEVDLRRRIAPRRILAALAHRHRAAPGAPMTVAQIVAAGWPGEKVIPESGMSRVYVAVMTLRNLGLRDCLIRRPDGYLIDPKVEIAIAST